jgi:dipeptidyl aminopeptidase/acylaminoacyl peptidase
MELTNNDVIKQDSGFKLDKTFQPVFSKDGRGVFFRINADPIKHPKKDLVSVDVWSYKDYYLQDQQISNERDYQMSGKNYTAFLDISSKKYFRLEEDDYKVTLSDRLEDHKDYVILTKGRIGSENWWIDSQGVSVWLYSLHTGRKVLLENHINYNPSLIGRNFQFSEDEKYLLNYDPVQDAFFSYAVSDGKKNEISHHLKGWRMDNNGQMSSPYWAYNRGVVGWLSQEECVLIYDDFDIWKLSLSGKYDPINLTNGYGRLNHVRFRMASLVSEGKEVKTNKLLLKAFSMETKFDGFYVINLSGKNSLRFLTMGPYAYSMPIKADLDNVWVVTREAANQAPNLCITNDFKKFTLLTDISPQMKYNWLTSELIQWKSLDGVILQGVLYKPQDFDSTKKYPIIFNYYQRHSDELFLFRHPSWSDDNINVPYFVSKGFLVVLPDIKYEIGTPSGRATENSVISAICYLKRFPWFDTTRIGIQGHSLGGQETNYLIAHSNVFAAAAEAAGVSDALSIYNSVVRERSSQVYYEMMDAAIRKTPWEDPKAYIDESAVYFADKVCVPLLMMHNKNDASVPWAQGLELFMALRRLRKPVWLLQYDGAGHSLRGKMSIDYTIRLEQFFNHYLKGAALPRWMNSGVPASLKGIKTGLELEP